VPAGSDALGSGVELGLSTGAGALGLAPSDGDAEPGALHALISRAVTMRMEPAERADRAATRSIRANLAY
jgi:hypothetical protein